MKRTQFWIFSPLLGVAAMVCRYLVFTLGIDSRGLLVPGSLPELVLVPALEPLLVQEQLPLVLPRSLYLLLLHHKRYHLR